MAWRKTARAAAIGFLIGFGVSTAIIWPEFFDRVAWAVRGGVGERACWDEPLFYMIMLGVPCGLVGAVVIAIGAAVFRFISGK